MVLNQTSNPNEVKHICCIVDDRFGDDRSMFVDPKKEYSMAVARAYFICESPSNLEEKVSKTSALQDDLDKRISGLDKKFTSEDDFKLKQGRKFVFAVAAGLVAGTIGQYLGMDLPYLESTKGMFLASIGIGGISGMPAGALVGWGIQAYNYIKRNRLK